MIPLLYKIRQYGTTSRNLAPTAASLLAGLTVAEAKGWFGEDYQPEVRIWGRSEFGLRTMLRLLVGALTSWGDASASVSSAAREEEKNASSRLLIVLKSLFQLC